MTTSFRRNQRREKKQPENKWNRERREEEGENISIKKANEIHLVVLRDEAAKQMLTINGAVP